MPPAVRTHSPSLAPTNAPTYEPVIGPVRLDDTSMRLEACEPAGAYVRARFGRALVPLAWRATTWAKGYQLEVRTAPPIAPGADGASVVRDGEVRLGGPLLLGPVQPPAFSSMEAALATASAYQLSHTLTDGGVVLDWADAATEADFYVAWMRDVRTTEIACVADETAEHSNASAVGEGDRCARFVADRSAHLEVPVGAIVRGGSVRVSTRRIALRRLIGGADGAPCDTKLHFFVMACNGTGLAQPRCDFAAPSNALLLGVSCAADARATAPRASMGEVFAERLAMADDRVALPPNACVVNTSLFLSAVRCSAAAEWSAWRCVAAGPGPACVTAGAAQFEWEVDACMHGDRVEVRPLGCVDEQCSAVRPTGTVIGFTVAHPADVRAVSPCLGKPAHEADTAGKVVIGLVGWALAIILTVAVSVRMGKAEAPAFDAHGSVLRMLAAVQFVGLTSDM
jgi:hypothetical protein